MQALAHEDGEDADDEYVYSHEGAELVCSRQQAWQELSYRQALELSQRVDKVRRSVVKAQANYQAQKQRLLPEESMIINQVSTCMQLISQPCREWHVHWANMWHACMLASVQRSGGAARHMHCRAVAKCGLLANLHMLMLLACTMQMMLTVSKVSCQRRTKPSDSLKHAHACRHMCVRCTCPGYPRMCLVTLQAYHTP